MNSANSIKFLYAAYTATWLIHAFYIGGLVRRYSRLRQQRKDLGQAGKYRQRSVSGFARESAPEIRNFREAHEILVLHHSFGGPLHKGAQRFHTAHSRP